MLNVRQTVIMYRSVYVQNVKIPRLCKNVFKPLERTGQWPA
jgi:hypothetical protein